MSNFKKLSRAEMKYVLGGENSPNGGGTCAWHGGGLAVCNLSKADAQAMAAGAGGNWCCSSCPSGTC